MADEELEQFCRAWVDKKAGYHEVKRYGGAGDLGRDVVGFITNKRHQGLWDNFQCKQYRKSLDVGSGLLAVGKVLYWASRGEFTVPRRFYFVAPKGLAGKLLGLIDKPDAFRARLVADWDTTCSTKIVARETISMDSKLEAAIAAFDFSEVHRIDVDEMIADPAAKPLLIERYGVDPGEYPRGSVPASIQASESRYVQALVDAYGEREKRTYANHDEVLLDPVHGPDFRMQRERYFEADGFQKFYRDCTSPEVIATFRQDIKHGVNAKWKADAKDMLDRIDSVMGHAATIAPAGPLSRYTYVVVRQGICHHFVNDGEANWKGSR